MAKAENNDMAIPVDPLTIAVSEKKPEYTGPRVRVFLPPLEDPQEAGLKVDQYEHVTIANEQNETVYRIHRGEWVDVPVPVFMILKDRYPQI